jgi:hypothetical protein
MLEKDPEYIQELNIKSLILEIMIRKFLSSVPRLSDDALETYLSENALITLMI